MEINTLDLNFQDMSQAIASYLVIGSHGPVLVETGPGSTVEVLIARLEEHGLRPGDIRYVLVTHIHLDHAGAAGWWARQGAQVYVHHVGAPHIVNPDKLLASAARIYGDRMDELWGETLPAPPEKVTALHEADTVSLGDLTFTALDTPGHAFHHHVYRLDGPGVEQAVAFTGDAAGIHIPGPEFADLPAPPPEFDLERWMSTIQRLLDQEFAAIYPTHFGRVDGWRHQLETLRALLGEATELVRALMARGLSRDQTLEHYLDWHRRRAQKAGLSGWVLDRYELANPHFMSVDGIMRYWRKKGSDA
jgi:glyoxylase-like metal-dependent hydrolase (beta-lactamase superfamily II)